MKWLKGLLPVVVCLLVLPAPANAEQRLSYAKAKRAIQAKADKFAGERTKIKTVLRVGDLSYSGSADWDRVDPDGCKGCGYDPVTGQFYDTPTDESCSVVIEATLRRSGKVATVVDSSICV
ncbi:MAG TPA: hypothetical protein VFX35_12175 [Solirubrobacterales bacterium]|nr:hypothetical protein [Solirubrobacterales bacterium]